MPRNNQRVTFIAQKRVIFKERWTDLNSYLDQNQNRVQAKLRFDRLAILFNEYEQLHAKLSTISPEDLGMTGMNDIQEDYYSIAERVENLTNQPMPFRTAH